MALETGTYISDLVVTNPAHTDGLNQIDSHLRLVKSALKTTFPNINGAVNVTDEQLNALLGAMLLPVDGSAAAPAISFASESTLGFYRDSAGHITITGGVLRGPGACPAGALMDFAMAAAPAGWVACDGQTLSRTGANADLFAAIGTTWGNGDGSGTTFTAPALNSRYRRHREGSGLAGAVGTLQSPANLIHTHSVSGTTATENAAHNHSFSGTTSAMSANSVHSHTYNNSNVSGAGVTGGGSFALPIGDSTGTTNAVNLDHTHTYAGITGTENQNHAHTFSVTSGAGSADNGNEARPYSATVLTCVKL